MGGASGPVARKVVAHLAKASAAREGEDVETQAASLLRRISISVHRENARAVLRRMPVSASPHPSPCPEAWGEDADMPWQ